MSILIVYELLWFSHMINEESCNIATSCASLHKEFNFTFWVSAYHLKVCFHIFPKISLLYLCLHEIWGLGIIVQGWVVTGKLKLFHALCIHQDYYVLDSFITKGTMTEYGMLSPLPTWWCCWLILYYYKAVSHWLTKINQKGEGKPAILDAGRKSLIHVTVGQEQILLQSSCYHWSVIQVVSS